MKLFRKVVARVDPRRDADVAAVLKLALKEPLYAESLQGLEELEVFGRRFTVEDLASLANPAGLLVGMYLTAMAVDASAKVEFKGAGFAGR